MTVAFWGVRSGAIALATVALASLLYACGDGDKSAARLDVAPPVSGDESDDEWLRRQERLTIRFSSTGETPTEKEATPAEAFERIRQYCYTNPPWDACDANYVDDVVEPLCIARTALSIATPQSTPVSLTWSASPYCGGPYPCGLTNTVVFDRITEANSAEFAALAVDYARLALDIALTKLEGTSPDCHSGTYWYDSNGVPKPAHRWASGAVEAYYLARAAYDRAVEANLAMSDAARSSSASPSDAARRAIVLQKYSRAATAHLLVGGDDGLLGSTTQGYCAGPRLSPKAQSALQLLRDAAPDPGAVLNNLVAVQDLLNSGTIAGGNIRQRLAGLYQIKPLGWNPTTQTVGAPSQTFESYYDLDEGDFTQARDFLQQEIQVFNRSLSAKLSAVNGVQRFAGTAGLTVSEVPAGAWTARARDSVGIPAWYQPNGSRWPTAPNGATPHLVANYRTPPLDALIGETYSRIRTLIRTTNDTFSTSGSLTEQREVFGLLASITLADEVKGAIQIVNPTANPKDFITTKAYGYSLADKVRVVVGEDGLRCAVQGSIEGASCSDSLTGALYGSTNATCAANPATLSCLSISTLQSGAENAFGMTQAVGEQRTGIAAGVIDSLVASKTRLYVVRLKVQGSTEVPGNYELLGGSTLALSPNVGGIYRYVAYPVIPSIDTRVAEVLAPSRKNCSEQSVDCLGVRMDARLPLEDELSEDGNGFENSWRHYLALARQAADETALLGREYRDAKLNKLQGAAAEEQRQEEKRQAAANALQEAQNICGTALDADKLLSFLSRDAGAPPTAVPVTQRNLGALVPPATAACPTGRCIVDVSKLTANDVKGSTIDDAERKRFTDCLDDTSATLEPFVNLGSEPVCIDRTTFQVTDRPLTAADEPGTCGGSLATTYPLKFFTKPSGSGNGGSNENACDLLRAARGSHSADVVSRLVKTGVFNMDRFKDRLGQLGFRAEYGGFFAITEDKSPRLSSGSGIAGRSGSWPWVNPPAACSTGSAGLFCQKLSATATAVQVGAFNARAYRATYAAAAALDEGLEAIYPAQDDMNNATPCNGKTHETEYHTSVAAGTGALPATMPVWTCAGRRRENLQDRLKYDRSIQPRTSGTQTSWILADGSILPSNSLNLWGYGSPRCVDITHQVCGDDNRGGSPGCKNVTTTACFWDDLSTTNPGPGLDKSGALTETWGGLSVASTFGTRGAVHSALKRASADTTTVLFEGGQDKDYMSPGTLRQRGNFAYYPVPLDVDATLDGLEILCELDRLRDSGSVPGGTLDLTTIDLAADALKRTVNGLAEIGARMTFANVPKLAVDQLNTSGPTGAFPALSGDMGEAVSSLRQGLISTQHALPVMSGAMRSMANEMQALTVQLQINQAQASVIDWDTLSTGLQQLTNCATAASDAKNYLTSFGSSTAVTCANSAAQIAISLKKSALQKDILQNQDELSRNAFIDRMSQIITDLEQSSIGLAEARESINASLARIDGLKKRGKLAVAKALYLQSYYPQAQAGYDLSVGSLESLAKRRFDQSLKNAKLMSFLAKRAIEQRLGLALKDQREDLPLVQAPALWEGEACSYSGFQDVTDPNGPTDNSATSPDDWVAKFGNGFIGDYVTKLENFVESYRLEQNFHEGKDTAVISLRDDVANVRAKCSTPARNLLKSSAEMTAAAWQPRFCDPVPNGPVSLAGINCISAALQTVGSAGGAVPDLAVLGLAGSQEGAAGFRVKFGDGLNCNSGDSGGCGWKPGSALGQIVHLAPGRHRLSWYTLDDPMAAATVINGAKAAIVILRGTGSLAAPSLVNSPDAPSGSPSPFVFNRPGSGARWKRASLEFKVAVEGDYEVGFGVATGSRPLAAQQVTVGAPMLEALPSSGGPFLLGNFQATDENGFAIIPDCEDTDGSLFRLKHFTRECVRMCTDGFSANCSSGPEHCYREFNFGFSQSALQNGKLLNYSGFARGNFNYRIESLGINFVGSNIRNCENASLPSTCYNAGFVPFSLQHNGPFYVRNRGGDDFPALLFDGRIEHARGLALDRYFTSPISSTDRDLMADYMRSEFSGRPLDGSFSLRVWEDQGVDFSSIEDVQLVLNYRYWTAFN